MLRKSTTLAPLKQRLLCVSAIMVLPSIPSDSTASESEFELLSRTQSAAISECETPSSDNISNISELTSLDDIKVENQMLKNEMASLHQDMAQMSERNKKIREGKYS